MRPGGRPDACNRPAPPSASCPCVPGGDPVVRLGDRGPAAVPKPVLTPHGTPGARCTAPPYFPLFGSAGRIRAVGCWKKIC